MWPRLAWWVASMAAIPVAKYVWDKIMESPSYQDEIAEINKAKEVNKCQK